MDNRFADEAIRRELERRSDGPSGACPDENLIAAYLEGGLDAAEAAAVESHAAGCAACREVLALSIELDRAEEPPRKAVTRGRAGFPVAVPVTLVAAVLILTGGLIFYRVISRSLPPQAPVARTAEARPPSEAQAPGPKSPPPAENPAGGVVGGIVAGAPASGEADARSSLQKVEAMPPAPVERKKGDQAAAEELRAEAAAHREGNPPFPRAAVVGRPLTAAESKTKALTDSGAVSKARTDVPDTAPVGLRRLSAPAAADMASARSFLLGDRLEEARRILKSADMETDAAAGDIRHAGERTFRRIGGIWIDLECMDHRNEGIENAPFGSGTAGKILEEVPDLATMARPGNPVLIYYQGKNILIY